MPKSRFNFYIEDYQRAGLHQIRERTGATESEQLRRAIDAWLKAHGVSVTAAMKAKRRETRRRR